MELVTRRIGSAAVGTALAVVTACQPYESETLARGERGIQPMLSQTETSDSAQDDARRAAQQRAEEEMRDQMMRDAAERSRAGAWEPNEPLPPMPPMPGEPGYERDRGITLPPDVGSDGRARVASPEFDDCVARYQRLKRQVDRYEQAPPEYVMVQENVDEPPRRVSCSQIKFYTRLGGDRARVYAGYRSQCEPHLDSGPIYEAAKADVTQTEQECYAIARRVGMTPGEARSRLR